MSLKVEVNGNKVSLEGFIDENSDLSPMKDLAGDVHIDFKKVSRINSCGVKEWVETIRQMNATLHYENCPLIVVKQLNAVPDFQGKAKVENFDAPYFCEECDEEHVNQLKSSDLDPSSLPKFNCPDCDAEMSFDGVAGQYFNFLKNAS